ncbi:outer membrane protein [Asticcacaulis sp. AND118]|uniref:outer membrane protein n=1 Tax=Asticcacaulis sp. AND118 TaxID=2840468 RepID=UPI001D00148A|nr:outer membrane beta-barrel protein [Asticcacaulis sp. AND118]UDF02730.1 outer membrane beta-barrel protein [Asticcacaulis sp. AND118]
MKTLFFSAAALTAFAAAPALAQSDFSGPYIAGQGGYAKTELEVTYNNGTTRQTASDDTGNGAAGVILGFNGQSNTTVFGVEADLNWNNANDRYDIMGEAVETGIDYSGALRARLGFVSGNTLFYGAAGVAGTRAYVEYDGEKGTETVAGWTAGIGADHAFSDRVFGRVEYRYTDFGDVEDDGVKAELTQQSVWLGLGMKF